MSAGNRKNPIRPNYTGTDILAHKRQEARDSILIKSFMMVIVCLVVIGTLLGFGIGRATAAEADSSPLPGNCWYHGNLDDILVIQDVSEITIDLSGNPKYSFSEFWCRKNGASLEAVTASTHQEVKKLRAFYVAADYQELRMFCRTSQTTAFAVTDLEDYHNKKRTPASRDAYNKFIEQFAAANSCRVL